MLMVLYVLHCVRASFFVSGTVTDDTQPTGHSPVSSTPMRTFAYNLKTLKAGGDVAFNSSAGMLSSPGDFQLLYVAIAALTSLSGRQGSSSLLFSVSIALSSTWMT